MRRLSLALVLAASLVAGCGSQSSTGGGGVVALEPFAAETLVALGERPAAVPDLSSAAPALRGLPTIAVDHSAGPDMERLATLDPELVVSSSTWSAFHPAVKRLGGELLTIDVRSVSDLLEGTRELGRAVGRERRAEHLVRSYRRALRRARRGIPAQGPEVLLIFGTVEGALTFLPSTYAGDLVRRLGGSLTSDGLRESDRFAGFAPLSMEEVVRRDPDVIIAVTHAAEGAGENAADRLSESPAWAGLRAVRDGRVHVIGADLLVTSPGPRLDEAVRRLRELMYG